MKRAVVVMIPLVVLGLALAVLTTPAVFAKDGSKDKDIKGPIQLAQIGQPIWMPVDFHLFTAAVGTPDDGYAEFGQTMMYLLYPLRHEACAELGRGPGDPHQPPYTREMQAGLDIMSFREARVFSASDFTPPNGVWTTWMTVPNPGTTGSSPDFKSGPIIPNTLFPIHVQGQTFRNNQAWDPYLADSLVPPLTEQLSCPFNVDGHSHFPFFIADTSSFGPGGPVTGHYQFRITMTDATGNGWTITVKFAVR